MVGIVIFALVAVFLGLRLYAVLGKRTGHEEPFMRVVEDVVRPLRPAVVDAGREAPSADPVEAVDPDVGPGDRDLGARWDRLRPAARWRRQPMCRVAR